MCPHRPLQDGWGEPQLLVGSLGGAERTQTGAWGCGWGEQGTKGDSEPRDVEPQAEEGVGRTCDEGGHAPAQHVVEAHGASIDVTHFSEGPIEVQGLQ